MSKLFLIPRQQIAPKKQTLTPKTVIVKTVTKAIALNVVIEIEIATGMGHETATEIGSGAIAAETVDAIGTETMT